mmetsp:Transcript_15614/g.38862  ORF Transcript_15614/g.38862 Transcript_15614/m.38862 type:complete len:225 (-) Transcript_15614:6-680(-)
MLRALPFSMGVWGTTAGAMSVAVAAGLWPWALVCAQGPEMLRVKEALARSADMRFTPPAPPPPDTTGLPESCAPLRPCSSSCADAVKTGGRRVEPAAAAARATPSSSGMVGVPTGATMGIWITVWEGRFLMDVDTVTEGLRLEPRDDPSGLQGPLSSPLPPLRPPLASPGLTTGEPCRLLPLPRGSSFGLDSRKACRLGGGRLCSPCSIAALSALRGSWIVCMA